MAAYDTQALATAQSVRISELPELTILFGSRARGDHDALTSDIDIMLVSATEPDATGKQIAVAKAEQTAAEIYGRAVDVQLVWRTLDAFRHNRRYINSVETNAVREGILMPRNHEEYSAANYEDEETEYEYSWANYDERVRHAEDHLRVFETLDSIGESDLMIAQRAHSALEHGMKALIAAHGGSYRNSHNLGHLLGTVRRIDPELANFSLSIPPDVYSEYAGESEYKTTRNNPLLTDFPDYRDRTADDVRLIIDRAREVRENQS